MLAENGRVALLSRSPVAWRCAAIFVLSHAIFLIGIAQPAAPYFDEVHYVPAVRQLAAGLGSQVVLNREHPPLAKELMSLGVRLFGDTPLGWRYMSALFGALTLVGMYVWALMLFDDEMAARWVALVTMANQVLYVQARIAMLDVFMMAFIVWALAAFTASWRPAAPVRWLFVATGTLVGLALASKWVGAVAWAICAGTVTLVKWLQWRGMTFRQAARSDWYRRDLWKSMRLGDWVLSLAVIPTLVNFLAFMPTYGRSPSRLIRVHAEMWRAQMSVPSVHPYASDWTSWPLLARPVWYLFNKLNEDVIQAVVFLGNPVVVWSGSAAIAVCVAAWLMLRRADAFVIVASFLGLYLCWAVVPRGLTLFYYYFPAAMVFGPALALVFYKTPLSRWPWVRQAFAAIVVALFLYFLPVSSAAVTVSMSTFARLMWFRSWI
jgi:dolichyl-phosphate-mannose--protein O-mannosyl transferase